MLNLTISLWMVLFAVLCATCLVAAHSYVAAVEYYEGDYTCSSSFYGGAAPSATLFAQTQNLADCARYLKDFAASFYHTPITLVDMPLGKCSTFYLGKTTTSLKPSCSLLPASVSLESFATQTLGGFQDHLSGKLWHYNNLTNCFYLSNAETNVTVIASQQYEALDLCLPVGQSGASRRVVVAEDQHSLNLRFWNASGNCSGDPAYTVNFNDSCTTAGSLILWPEPSITPTVSPTPVIPSPSSTPLSPSPSTSASVPTASTGTSVPAASSSASIPTGSGGPAAPNTSTPVSSPAAVGSSGIVSKPIEFVGLMLASTAFILFTLN